MKGIIEAFLGIIVCVLLLQALFPGVLAQIVKTTLTALFVGVLVLVVGFGIWIAINFLGD